MEDCYNQGWTAYEEGMSNDDCPISYDDDPEAFGEWMDGWHDAYEEDQ